MTVTPNLIQVALGRTDPPSETEANQWQLWIDDATMLIEARAIELGVDPSTLEAAKLDYVVRQAVVYLVRRPDDATQVTVSVQDASTSRMYRSGKGRIEILEEWWKLLGLSQRSTGTAFAVDTAYGAGVHAAICSLNFGATYCSCGADLTNYAYPLFETDPTEVSW